MKKLIILALTGLIAVTQVKAIHGLGEALIKEVELRKERLKARDMVFKNEQIDTSTYLYKYSKNGTILVIPKPVEPIAIDTLYYDTTTWKRFKLSTNEQIKLLNGESLEKTEESKTNANIKYLFLIYTQDKIETFRLTKNGFSSVSTQISPEKLDWISTWPILGLILCFIISIWASSSSIPGSIFGLISIVCTLCILHFEGINEDFYFVVLMISSYSIAMSGYSMACNNKTKPKHGLGIFLMLLLMCLYFISLIIASYSTNQVLSIKNIPTVYPAIYIIIGLYLGSIIRIMIKNHKNKIRIPEIY